MKIGHVEYKTKACNASWTKYLFKKLEINNCVQSPLIVVSLRLWSIFWRLYEASGYIDMIQSTTARGYGPTTPRQSKAIQETSCRVQPAENGSAGACKGRVQVNQTCTGK